MIKRLVLYLKRRNDKKLRLWCVEKAAGAADCSDSVVPVAKLIYDWIRENPES